MTNSNVCLILLLVQKIALYVYAIVLLFGYPLIFQRYSANTDTADKDDYAANSTLIKVDPMHLMCTVHRWFDDFSSTFLHRNSGSVQAYDSNHSVGNVTKFLGLPSNSVLSPSLLQFGACVMRRSVAINATTFGRIEATSETSACWCDMRFPVLLTAIVYIALCVDLSRLLSLIFCCPPINCSLIHSPKIAALFVPILSCILWIGTVALALNFKWETSDWFLDDNGNNVPYLSTPKQWSCLIMVAFGCGLVNMLEICAVVCCSGDGSPKQYQCDVTCFNARLCSLPPIPTVPCLPNLSISKKTSQTNVND